MREMKNSGVEWIGEIPVTWKLKTIKQLFLERNEKNRELKVNTVLSLSAKDGVSLYEEGTHSGNKPREDLSDYKIVRVNDIVVNSMNILSGSVGLSAYEGVVSPVYYIYYPRENVNINYFYKLFQCFEFQRSLRGLGNGILIKETDSGALNTIRMRISSQKLGAQYFPVCSDIEQHKIATHLDTQCSKIDTLIANQQSQIEKLKTYKQSLITEVVTKGLDKNVPMKDSGVEWIGEIPKHWEDRKMLSILAMRVIDGPHESPELLKEGIPYISATAIVNGKIDFSLMRGYISEEYCNECDKRYKPQLGDLLVIKLGASTGQVAIVDTEERFNIWVPLAAVRCNDLANPKFIYYAFQSNYFIKQMELSWTFGTQQTLGVKTIERLRVILPSIEEQKEIVNFLENKCNQIDQLTSIKQQKIEKLTQYKKSLIYEYVTGKKEVK